MTKVTADKNGAETRHRRNPTAYPPLIGARRDGRGALFRARHLPAARHGHATHLCPGAPGFGIAQAARPEARRRGDGGHRRLRRHCPVRYDRGQPACEPGRKPAALSEQHRGKGAVHQGRKPRRRTVRAGRQTAREAGPPDPGGPAAGRRRGRSRRACRGSSRCRSRWSIRHRSRCRCCRRSSVRWSSLSPRAASSSSSSSSCC